MSPLHKSSGAQRLHAFAYSETAWTIVGRGGANVPPTTVGVQCALPRLLSGPRS
jgi:hypothetical protein